MHDPNKPTITPTQRRTATVAPYLLLPLLLAAPLLPSVTAAVPLAVPQPAEPVATYQRTGQIDAIDYRRREVVINDTLYHLDPHATSAQQTTEAEARAAAKQAAETLFALQPGRHVAFRYRLGRAPQRDTIEAIWLVSPRRISEE